RALRDRLQELEVVELDRLRVLHLAGDFQDRRREADVALLRMELRGEAGVRLDAVELLEEIDVEECAAEFPVGDALQPHVLLELDDPADCRVLELAQLLLRNLAGGMPVARLEQLFRAQEAADVVGSERGLLACAHQPGSFTFSILSNSMFQSLPSFISQRRM